ncbi:cyclin-H [Contarinia nasturtii]|uniref:cyclin-H n=1 Tax=Contarinia nasturtii TaxID=265458 RepID=UPI0012D486B7|nr:cyclin-H [Contarinia nasturtii]XP_031636991.1 cyclin-H [Contarinia nasturtii]XP_031636992.1 cyclin-H [Contarinia nasturtii]
MFPTSSQRHFWTFHSEEQIQELRRKHNQEYQQRYNERLNLNPEQQRAFFLSYEEEQKLLRNYEYNLKEFCRRFEPPMPKCVVGTAFHYFKRFYLYNSAMDYHPKEILATCVYLACKTEEFNVSIGQFVGNIRGDRVKAMDIILSNELLLMQRLNYYLTIHNPYRPVEGFLIDIKTRGSLLNPDRLRNVIDDFLERSFFTEACLLYAPSQIALAAVLRAASKEQENLDSYVTQSLFGGCQEKLDTLIGAVRNIRLMVTKVAIPEKEEFKRIEKKLEKCRNQENNPDSEEYKIRMRRMMLEDEDDLDVALDTSSFSMVDRTSLANESMISLDP